MQLPKAPEDSRADALSLGRHLNHVDVQPVAKRIDALVDLTRTLAIHLDLINKVSTGIQKMTW
ncbi:MULTISPECIES: hypothetical protein [Pseudomonas syringae group]|uniref:Uncharacterized protein n=3 Tax=Pseudomonas syringae group TaxID=136849 RepID=A0A2K4W8M9_9PSED|nr:MULTISPECIES: hypothetical protein [Pseudomonas syringae group]KWS64680.1 hypothetical protein AL055_01240 [Pseudomonas amygdali pv. morsprunorum]MDU8432967.1 hypothetical protein [Pseudomonas syringae pv. actinidifoliorum]MDU8523878.1 hypothetical protein [Pseudomonas syringae pv. actinidifoliorum]MDU8528850.1 hypothetical protein [Pseudomonas syringae pv. actinidifoliorum]PHN49714.1 hypothetical protein AO261_02930 [Pseudomonas avellanae]